MKIVFMGSPDFAVLPLRKMVEEGFSVEAVFSQPDRLRGKRGKELLPTPVKQAALAMGIPVFTPEKINTAEAIKTLSDLQPDLLVVVAYGQILSDAVLAIPRLGAINIHASLLPYYRGAAPMQRALMNGESKSGVTIMYLDSGMDTGDMIISRELELSPDESFGSLHDKLMEMGAELLLQALRQIAVGSVQAIPQEADKASYAAKISREEEQLSWEDDAAKLHNHIRALDPFPGAYVLSGGKRLKLFGSSLITGEGSPGQVLAMDNGTLSIACGKGAIRIAAVQPEGKKKMEAAAFARGRKLEIGGKI